MKNTSRREIEILLKEQCVPELRRAGFKGSFPNLYRATDNFIALLNFQFYSAGGSLCVNLSYADPERTNIAFRPETNPSQIRISQARERMRLGGGDSGDKWYSFGETSYGEYRSEPIQPSELVFEITKLIQSEGEEWWKNKHSP